MYLFYLHNITGEMLNPPYHGSPAIVRKLESVFDYSGLKPKMNDYLELQLEDTTSNTNNLPKRQSPDHPLSKSANIPCKRCVHTYVHVYVCEFACICYSFIINMIGVSGGRQSLYTSRP